MNSLQSIAFKIIDRPYVVWSYDVREENFEFLESIDSNFYHRTALTVFFDGEGAHRFDSENTEARKDVASLARLIWNHGLETLVMLLGAYVQAPFGAHAFFLKCKNEDSRKIAKYLLSGQIPKDNCLTLPTFSFDAFVRGIHRCSNMVNDDETMHNFSRALSGMLQEYDRNELRAEYNSIKHGLRAHHGRFALATGQQETKGVRAREEEMVMLSDSPDGSHFLTTATFRQLAPKVARQQFSVQHSSVGWSLEKTLNDIQLFSPFIGNVVEALKIANGKEEDLQFFRPEVDSAWWSAYFNDQGPDVRSFSFGGISEVPRRLEDAQKRADRYYRELAKARKENVNAGKEFEVGSENSTL